MKQKIEMKNLGELCYSLGIEVIRSRGGIWLLLQRQYGLDMLYKNGMIGCKPIYVPLEQNVKLNAKEGELLEDAIVYICIVGSLIYMTTTRVDLWALHLEMSYSKICSTYPQCNQSWDM